MVVLFLTSQSSPLEKSRLPLKTKTIAPALLDYRNRQDPDDASAIENFVQTHPDSPRLVPLLNQLGAHYRRTCQFSKAMATYQQVWDLGKNITDPNGKELTVDQSAADWATLLSMFGRVDMLKTLLQEVQGRDLRGVAAVRISDMENVLCKMVNKPQKAFKNFSVSRHSACA